MDESTGVRGEYQDFLDEVGEDGWKPQHHDGALYDLSLTHENGREILINFTQNRIACRDAETGVWGLRQEHVSDLAKAVSKLIGTGLQVPLHELQYLGLEEHPEHP